MSPEEIQRLHDQMHPGMICARCPVADRRRKPWWRRLLRRDR